MTELPIDPPAESDRDAALSDMTNDELFDLLDDRIKDQLQSDFISTLDEGDIGELFFCVKDYSDRLIDLSASCDRKWEAFLERKNLLNDRVYRYWINRGWEERQ